MKNNLNIQALEAHGKVIRERKRPGNLFLNLFPGKFIAKCRSEEIAKAIVDAYNTVNNL